jgi:hypothetical protein
METFYTLKTCLEQKKSVCHAALPPPPLTNICRVDFSVALRDRELKFWTHLWFGLKLCMSFLEFRNFLSKILKFLNLKNLEFDQYWKQIQCVFGCVKKFHTQNLKILTFLKQNFC